MPDFENELLLGNDWDGHGGKLCDYIVKESKNTLDAYKRQPNLVDEHANHEEDTARGGYAHRQLFELVQNSADALASKSEGGSIALRLTEEYLYCADNGDPISQDGVKALMFSHLSAKRGTNEIGRFGLGFKSVLGVTEAPEFFSRSGSFCFNRDQSRKRIQQVAPNAKSYPTLRLPDPIDLSENRDNDDILRELMCWATNIVRLPLKPEAHEDLIQQMSTFPAEFLLFVMHVSKLTLNDELSSRTRTLELRHVDAEYHLEEGDQSTRWKLFNQKHLLSDEAQADRRSLDGSHDVPIWWAVPLDHLADPGYFWAFFPTQTASLAAGILNAPWKTNEDRQNLLPGPYNHNLIKAAARMIADALPDLSTKADPARHLDALPRRYESGDSKLVDLLRDHLVSLLRGRRVVPNQDGKLYSAEDILYPPKALTPDRGGIDLAPFERWALYPGRPSNWLHHKALTRNRLATIDRLCFPRWRVSSPSAPRATIAQWLEALVENQKSHAAVQASMAAIQTAALVIPKLTSTQDLGKIVLTGIGNWCILDPERVFLPYEFLDDKHASGQGSFVHPELASDSDTCKALAMLGIKQISPTSRFKLLLEQVMTSYEKLEEDSLEEIWRNNPPSSAENFINKYLKDNYHRKFSELGEEIHKKFWILARSLDAKEVSSLIQEYKNWQKKLWVRTQSNAWKPFYSVLLPGMIAPGRDLHDDGVAVDMEFHYEDEHLLELLGAADSPHDQCDLSSDSCFLLFLFARRDDFTSPDRNLPRNPQRDYLNFKSTVGAGPLQILTTLSEEGKAQYTDALLSLDATYKKWTMRHDTQEIYRKLPCVSPAIHVLKKHGRIKTSGDIVPFEYALGSQPKSPSALYSLQAHSKADKIISAFNLEPPTPEFIGEEDPIFLTDEWPGLRRYLPRHQRNCQLVRCKQILVGGSAPECVFHASNIYLSRTDNDRHEIQLISARLELNLDKHKLEKILRYKTRKEIEERRADVRKYSTDSERLLAAVGEDALRPKLPPSLLEILKIENKGRLLTGIQVADAAIATYHSDALRQYRTALSHLDPPKQWAGRRPAVDFVLSLGFSAEWAGERNRKRAPFLQVEGPFPLPKLHDYQETIVANVRDMLRAGHVNERRGMISLPTGSGKTRVAVQAITEAICRDGFNGGILWVADRDELCEQAVEAWRRVYSSIGPHGSQLRVSRMWAGQPRPLPTSDGQVVIATIQTLNVKLSNQPGDYSFLTKFKLVVFDEAHRSIAPTFTSVMNEIGLTRRQEADEPFLIGLTATPYRGYNEEETAWLARRYGSNRLDAGAFANDDPQAVIRELQNKCVLARADHETIEGGTFLLNEGELRKMQQLSVPWLPQSMEDRIARDVGRTQRIIEAYERHINQAWPTLIFATSVEHAKTVAALLNAKGIKSRAVSGETETGLPPILRTRTVQLMFMLGYGVDFGNVF